MSDDLSCVWEATRDRYPDEMRVILHAVSCAPHFPGIRQNLTKTFSDLKALGEAHGYDPEDFLGMGIMTCFRQSLGVARLSDL